MQPNTETVGRQLARQVGIESNYKETNNYQLSFQNKILLFSIFSASLLFILHSDMTFAADALDAQTNAPSETLQEIVVTAQKRESTVMKTPISITAVSGADLQSRGLDSAQAITQTVPGIAVSSAGPGQAQYEIRGLSAGGGESPTVGFYLDETSITPPATASTGKSEIDPDLYDLARVEVLRGPQGTLYGAGSLGGTVKLVTNKPDFQGFYGSAQTTGSGTEGGSFNYSQKAMLNIPIVSDVVALRLVGDVTHNSGWIDRVVESGFPLPNSDGSRGNVLATPASVIHHGVNDEDLRGGRAALLIKPIDALTINLSIFYQSTSQGGINAYDNPPGIVSAHYQPFDVAEPYSDDFTVYSLNAGYEFEGFSLTSVSSYWHRKSSQLEDNTEQVTGVLGLTSYDVASGGIGPAQAFEYDTTNEFSQEVRLASTGSGPFQWILGGFYSSFNDTLNLGSTIPGLATAAAGAFGTTNFVHVIAPLKVKQEAGFLHASYAFSSGIKLEAGARYFAYQSSFNETANGFAYGGDTPVVTPASASASGVNPMVNLSWSPQGDYLVYASAAKGFREGAGNTAVPTDSASQEGAACAKSLQSIGLSSAPTSYAPDTVWSYEVGEKARLFDGRLVLNTDAFYMVWSDVQQPVGLSCGLGFTANGPAAHVRGGEAELTAQLTKGFTLSQNVGYANAMFVTDYLPAAVVKGQTLYDSPRWTLNTSLRYQKPIGRYTLVAQAQNSYQSATEDVSYQVNQVPSRNIANFRLGFEVGKWSAYAFVNNAFNVHAVLENMNLITITGPNFNRVATNQPLTAGFQLSTTF